MSILTRLLKTKKEEPAPPTDLALEKTNKRIQSKIKQFEEGGKKPKPRKASKMKPGVKKSKAKSKVKAKKKSSNRSSFKKFLKKETEKKQPMVLSIFRDEAGELCVRAVKPINMMTREEYTQFQRETLLALMNLAADKKADSRKK